MELKINKKIIENSNINFLIGSGASVPFFGVLSNIENWLTDLDKDKNINEEEYLLLKFLFYREYYQIAMKSNIDILKNTTEINFLRAKKNYENFFKIIRALIFERKSNLFSKQINVFTTNIDIFHEYVLDQLNYDFNDGFFGRFKPKLDLSSFRRTFHKESLFFNKMSEIPIFNIYKLHGSVNWKYDEGEIILDLNLSLLKEINKLLNSINITAIEDQTKTYDEIKKIITKNDFEILQKKKDIIKQFIESYEKLQIINPTKEKFQETVFKKTHYELLRIFSNELEKENTILIVIGFSFADEHIRDITIRALNYNPLLNVFVYDYDGNGVKHIEIENTKIKNNNLHIIKPQENYQYDFENINHDFENILKEIKEIKED